MMETIEKTALVTGASRGIGRAIALTLAAKGYAVALNYAGSQAAAEAVKGEIEAAGGKAFTIQGDVSKAEDVDRIFKTIKEEFGQLDVLVNNAGITRDGLLIRMKEESWDAVLSTDLKSDFLTIKAAAQMMMRKKKGSIINIASVVGIMGNIGQANYAAAKAGVIGLTKACAKELAARNIRVNAVAPGFIATDMTDAIPEKNKEAMLTAIPLGRMGLAEDVAKAVSFLASDDASYITGQVLKVDGGMVM
jgi:3-oxoacyl-[acyl-carrier protein] reductase